MSAAAEVPAERSSSFTPNFWVGPLDLRPIALFRIVFGLFIAYDLLDLLPNAVDFFSDVGVMPRNALLAEMARQNRFSLSDLAGPPEAVYAYWLGAFVACLFFIAGYRSRIAQVVLFLFMAGFNERLPQLFDGSDSVIRLTLFWLMFVPAANRYSVDAILARNRGQPLPERAIALPVRLVQAQIAWVYLCSFFHKTGGMTWQNGTALHYVLHLNHVFARPWASALADYPVPMAFGTYFTLVFEAGFMLLVFFPVTKVRRWTKALGLLMGTALHGGIALTVNVGLFSYLMPITYLSFFEPEWTEWLIGRLKRLCGAGTSTVLYDGECPICVRAVAALKQMDRFENLAYVDFRSGKLPEATRGLKPKDLEKRMHVLQPSGAVAAGFPGIAAIFARLPATFALALPMRLPGIKQLGGSAYDWVADHRHALARCDGESCELPVHKPRPALGPEWLRRTVRDAVYIAVTALFIATAWYACPSDGSRYLPPWASRTVQWFSLWNIWDMFSPEPLRTDYHLRAVAEFSDGTSEDLFGGPVNGPGEVRGFWFTRWWKYMENVIGGGETMPREWARWVCRTRSYNVPVGERRLYAFTLKKESQIIPPMGQPWPPVQNFDVWNWRCYEKPASLPAPHAAELPHAVSKQ